MNTIKKTSLTLVVSATLCFVEWRMWWFFRHEFKVYNPSDETAVVVFILWAIFALAFAGIAVALLSNIYKPKIKENANVKQK